MVLPDDYDEEFNVHNTSGGLWGQIDSKMFCGDKAVFWRACRSQLLALADELRITGSPLQITSRKTGRQWTVNTVDDLRAWTQDTGREPVFDQPRTDPYLLTTPTGFSVRLQSHLDPTDAYSLHTNPLASAILELRSGAGYVTACNLVSKVEIQHHSEDALVHWALELHDQLGQAVRAFAAKR